MKRFLDYKVLVLSSFLCVFASCKNSSDIHNYENYMQGEFSEKHGILYRDIFHVDLRLESGLVSSGLNSSSQIGFIPIIYYYDGEDRLPDSRVKTNIFTNATMYSGNIALRVIQSNDMITYHRDRGSLDISFMASPAMSIANVPVSPLAQQFLDAPRGNQDSRNLVYLRFITFNSKGDAYYLHRIYICEWDTAKIISSRYDMLETSVDAFQTSFNDFSKWSPM